MIRFNLPKRPEDLETGPVAEDHICVQQVTAIEDESIGEAFAEGVSRGPSLRVGDARGCLVVDVTFFVSLVFSCLWSYAPYLSHSLFTSYVDLDA